MNNIATKIKIKNLERLTVLELMEDIMNNKNENPIIGLLKSESYNMNGDIEYKRAYINYKMDLIIAKNNAYDNGKDKAELIRKNVEKYLKLIENCEDSEKNILLAMAHLPQRDDLQDCSYAMQKLQDIIGFAEDCNLYEKYREVLYGMTKYYTGQDSGIDSFMLQDHSQPAPF